MRDGKESGRPQHVINVFRNLRISFHFISSHNILNISSHHNPHHNTISPSVLNNLNPIHNNPLPTTNPKLNHIATPLIQIQQHRHNIVVPRAMIQTRQVHGGRAVDRDVCFGKGVGAGAVVELYPLGPSEAGYVGEGYGAVG